MQNLKTIIITGSNKGIGLGMVQDLAGKQGWNIIMGCRNIELANQSMNRVRDKYPNAKISIQELDISNNDSVMNFVDTIKTKYQSVDILLNNAGVYLGDASDPKAAKYTLRTNFYGTIQLSQAMIPLIADGGKIITVGSQMGKLNVLPSKELQEKFSKKDITSEQLKGLITQYDIVQNNYQEKGWPTSVYGVSKLGINIYARVLSQYPQILDRKIQIYVGCPGQSPLI